MICRPGGGWSPRRGCVGRRRGRGDCRSPGTVGWCGRCRALIWIRASSMPWVFSQANRKGRSRCEACSTAGRPQRRSGRVARGRRGASRAWPCRNHSRSPQRISESILNRSCSRRCVAAGSPISGGMKGRGRQRRLAERPTGGLGWTQGARGSDSCRRAHRPVGWRVAA
jgi:hypothetical protein